MLDWLKSIFRSDPPAEPNHELIPAPVPPSTSSPTPVSRPAPAPSPPNAARQFRSAAVAELYSQIADITHPDYPFLDRSYSPGSYMPAADFSPWIASRRKQQDRAAIEEGMPK